MRTETHRIYRKAHDKKEKQESKAPTDDMANLLDDLFAEAVEAVESVGDESKPKQAKSEEIFHLPMTTL